MFYPILEYRDTDKFIDKIVVVRSKARYFNNKNGVDCFAFMHSRIGYWDWEYGRHFSCFLKPDKTPSQHVIIESTIKDYGPIWIRYATQTECENIYNDVLNDKLELEYIEKEETLKLIKQL